MNESIKDYIQKNYTPDMQEVLHKMVGLLDRLNINTYEAYILNKLSELDNEDTEFTSTEIVNYFDGFLYNLQKEFGFILTDSITFEQRIEFVKAYVALEDYIDHEAIIRITETDKNDTEKLAEAVSLTIELTDGNGLPISADALMGFIEYVDEAAIFTLEQLHLTETDTSEFFAELSGPVASEEQVTQVRAYNLFVKDAFKIELPCMELVRRGYSIGLPFKLYWNERKDDLLQQGRQETESYLSSFAAEMIGIYLLSQEYWNNPALSFTNMSEEIFDDLKTITDANNNIKFIMNAFTKFKSENRIK